MGIRDEIERLRKAMPKNVYAPIPNDVAPALSYYTVYNSAVSDVLSILDEWRLVGEGVMERPFAEIGWVFVGEGKSRGWEGPFTHIDKLCLFNPRDHIAIYVRRGKKDE